MTVQAGVEISLELMVGEMPVVPCDLKEHNEDLAWHDEGPASHYMRGACDCGREPVLFAGCQAFVDHVLADRMMRCSQCEAERPATMFITILAPVKS